MYSPSASITAFTHPIVGVHPGPSRHSTTQRQLSLLPSIRTRSVFFCEQRSRSTSTSHLSRSARLPRLGSIGPVAPAPRPLPPALVLCPILWPSQIRQIHNPPKIHCVRSRVTYHELTCMHARSDLLLHNIFCGGFTLQGPPSQPRVIPGTWACRKRWNVAMLMTRWSTLHRRGRRCIICCIHFAQLMRHCVGLAAAYSRVAAPQARWISTRLLPTNIQQERSLQREENRLRGVHM